MKKLFIFRDTIRRAIYLNVSNVCYVQRSDEPEESLVSLIATRTHFI